jgi:hypothetical protein
MPRFPPKEKRFCVDARVRGSSKAYKKRKLGTVRNISHVGDGPRRRRRIEVEWDDNTREIVLSNAIELLGDDDELKDDGTPDSPPSSHHPQQQLLQQQLRQDQSMMQMRITNDSDSENDDEDMNMTNMIDPTLVSADGQYHVFAMDSSSQPVMTAIPSQATLAHHAALANQHLHMKVSYVIVYD